MVAAFGFVFSQSAFSCFGIWHALIGRPLGLCQSKPRVGRCLQAVGTMTPGHVANAETPLKSQRRAKLHPSTPPRCDSPLLLPEPVLEEWCVPAWSLCTDARPEASTPITVHGPPLNLARPLDRNILPLVCSRLRRCPPRRLARPESQMSCRR